MLSQPSSKGDISERQNALYTESFWVFQRRTVLFRLTFRGQKMRLTEGLETSSTVVVPSAAGKLKSFQCYVDHDESEKSRLKCLLFSGFRWQHKRDTTFSRNVCAASYLLRIVRYSPSMKMSWKPMWTVAFSRAGAWVVAGSSVDDSRTSAALTLQVSCSFLCTGP